VATTTLLVSKQLGSADALQAYEEAVEPREDPLGDAAGPCYLLMARLTSASVEKMETVASAA
jgi:hypothetical protein